MIRLAWTFLRSAGWGGALLLLASTAVATALLLVALTMLLLPSAPAETLFNLVAEPGLRVGTAFATAMLVLPLLLMLHQVVRLGTASRERRLATLRLAGATPAEVHRIGAIEVGIPVTAGAVAGPLLFTVLRQIFGGGSINPSTGRSFDATYVGAPINPPPPTYDWPLALIPTSVTPAWWQILAIVTVVAALGMVTGALASRHLIASPLGVSRRAPRPPPRPWGVLLVGAGLVAMAAAVSGMFGGASVLLVVGGLLSVLGVLALAPWVAFRSGQRAARRTSDPATLIAAGHLMSDPRPAGRAAAAVGAIGIVSGGAGVVEAAVFFGGSLHEIRDPFFVTSFLILGGALVLVLIVTASALSVHAAESVMDRRRVLAGLVAAGTPVSVLRESLRREAMLTSLPLTLGGLLFGAAVAAALWAAGAVLAPDRQLILGGLLLVCVQLAVTVALMRVAITVAIRVVMPRLVRAAAPANLRTE